MTEQLNNPQITITIHTYVPNEQDTSLKRPQIQKVPWELSGSFTRAWFHIYQS